MERTANPREGFADTTRARQRPMSVHLIVALAHRCAPLRPAAAPPQFSCTGLVRPPAGLPAAQSPSVQLPAWLSKWSHSAVQCSAVQCGAAMQCSAVVPCRAMQSHAAAWSACDRVLARTAPGPGRVVATFRHATERHPSPRCHASPLHASPHALNISHATSPCTLPQAISPRVTL